MKIHYLSILALANLLGLSYYLGYTPVALGIIFAIASVVAYALYAKDKSAARAGTWRVSENSLHITALMCGWPGALIAQERLRHKTQKKSFRTVFWLSVLMNLGGVIWLHSPQGNRWLREGAYQVENFALSNVTYRAPVEAILLLTTFRAK